MDEDIFNEYEPIIRYSLEYVGFEESVLVLPSAHPTFLYVVSKYRKDCIVDIDVQLLNILLPIKPIIVYPSNQYRLVNRINLAHPNSIETLGLTLSDILMCAI